MKSKGIILLFFFGFILTFSKSPNQKSFYIDRSLPKLEINVKANLQTFHIFSHGKPGYLFIDNQWLSASKVALKFKEKLVGKKELYIYGCNFGEGAIGHEAVNYLQKHLKMSVNASTNTTGENGDWNLEIGKGKNGIKLPDFKGNLQLDIVHYLNPMISGAYNTNNSIQEEFIYLSTPSISDINVSMTYPSEIGSPRISITHLSLPTTDPGYVTYTSSGIITLKNSTPVRIQFVDAANVVLLPGTTPTTVALTKGGTVIPGNTAGLKFTSTDKFYVNYRARSQVQAGSELTKGVSALGREFRWGGSPIEVKTNVVELGNMLSIMATSDNTTIVISNIKDGTFFVNGTGTTTITAGSTITKLLQKGDSFILYAPVTINSTTRTPQDAGWLGAKVISDKNITVVVGGLMQIGPADGQRDIGFDQLVPVPLLGLEHIIMQGNGGSFEKAIVVASVAGTKVYVNGNTTPFTTLLNAGDYTLIPASNFINKNMYVRVSSPAYVFNKIFGSNIGTTSSLMFIPPLSCFGQTKVDLIPAARTIGTTNYNGTELVVLAAADLSTSTTNINKPDVTLNNVAVITSTALAKGDAVTGNSNWVTYRYPIAGDGNVFVTSKGTIQAELFGANGDAGFGGYYSGFGTASSYELIVSSPYGFICPGTGTLSVPAGLGTYQWYRNDVAIPNTVANPSTNNNYTLNGSGDTVIATYYVIVTFPGGCNIRSNEVTSDTCPCTKSSTIGTPNTFTKLGISVRDSRSTLNWPKDVGNGFLAMEGNNKGFVITRIASPETAIGIPVLGMLVYDTTKNCLELYDGTSWKCIKPTCN